MDSSAHLSTETVVNIHGLGLSVEGTPMSEHSDGGYSVVSSAQN